MAAFDQVDSAEAVFSTSVNLTGFAPTGSNRLLMVCGGVMSTGPETISSITKGATAITLESWNVINAPFWRGFLRYLVAPSTASETVTFTADSQSDALTIGVISLTAVDQTTPLGTAVTASADSFNPAGLTVSSATGDLVVGSMMCGWHTNTTFQGDGTERVNRLGVGNYADFVCSTAPGAASVNVEWGAGTGYNSAHVLGGVNVNNVAGVGGATPKGPLGHVFNGPFGGPI